MIDLLKATGYELPPRETDYSDLTTKEVFDKIKDFMDNANPKYEDLVFGFWQLIAEYPVSMCERKMSDTLKLLITLYYYYKPPKIRIEDRDLNELYRCFREQFKRFFSYEELAILFMRSKASIHDAIKEKEAEVKRLVEEANIRRHAKSIAWEEIVAEEKLKLLEKYPKEIEKTNKQTNIHVSA